MAEALIKGFLAADRVSPSRLLASDSQPARLAYLAETYEIRVCSKNYELARDSDIIFIAVKPGNVDSVLGEIAGELTEQKLIISVAAGITTARIMEALQVAGLKRPVPVIRAMPNTPVTVGEGATALSAGTGAGQGDIEVAKSFFNTVGLTLFVEDESLMDAVTALSGSGPAYVFFIMEALVEAGIGLGIPASEARALAVQTTLGAAKLAMESGVELPELRKRVTSPGGTTAEGLKVFEESGLRDIIIKAVEAAQKRSKELSGAP